MHLAPAPEPRDLLPPLLACLPTAFVSSNPPPALLPLLSPLLRQRVTFLSGSNQPTSRSDGWLPLLSWDGGRGARLPAVVERMHLEPHPVSGEVEIDDVRPAKYRRLDEETLQSRLEVEQFDLLPVYAWCESDENGGTGAGWKLAELQTLEDASELGQEWFESIADANDAASTSKTSTLTARNTNGGSNGRMSSIAGRSTKNEERDDDAAYWASYDQTPGTTPSKGRSPAPPNLATSMQQARGIPAVERRDEETDYYARYGNEVQPALDAHDPDEEAEGEDDGKSTLNGNTLFSQPNTQANISSPGPHGTSLQASHQARPNSRPNGTSLFPADVPSDHTNTHHHDLEAPRPYSPTSSHSSIDRLEQQAAAMSRGDSEGMFGDGDERAHRAIKQHISTDVKSLFRLARAAGMEREEFEEIVRRELEVLSLLEQDD